MKFQAFFNISSKFTSLSKYSYNSNFQITTPLDLSTFFGDFVTSTSRPILMPKHSTHSSTFGTLSAEFVTLPTTSASKWSASIAYKTSGPISSELNQNDFPNWAIYLGIGILGILILLVFGILLWVNS